MRTRNEDAFVVADLGTGSQVIEEWYSVRLAPSPDGVLIAVSDGMGGASAGDLASRLVVESLAQGFLGARDQETIDRVEAAVEHAHRAVHDTACVQGIKMGATLTALFVRGGHAYVAEVGDSRAYLLRRGELTQLTKDQSYAQTLVDQGVLAPAEARDAPFRNVILQAMGQQPSLRAVVGRLELRAGDCIMLCSDGVHGPLTDEEIKQLLLTSSTLEAACEAIIQAALDAGAPDNATLALVRVGGDIASAGVGETVDETYRVVVDAQAAP
ncbi:MAG: serine/threonine-protein phosphatase [Myxococcales bacterium]|nr:serine/threonine-protein phosphatase [Myxococcales bacterium]